MSTAPEDVGPFLTAEEVRRLAAGDWVQRDDWMDAAGVAAIREALAPSLEDLRPAGTGASRVQNREIRGDRIRWLEATGSAAMVHTAFAALGRRLSRDLWLGIAGFELQLAAYEADARYARHKDASRHRSDRVLTAILYLNPDWQPCDGGELRLHCHDGTTHDLAPLAGRLILFRSDELEHEVRPAQRRRLAVTAWYRSGAPEDPREPFPKNSEVLGGF